MREAASRGANVVLLQELFATPYFCIDEDPRHFDLARPVDGHPIVERFRRLAAELGVVLPVSVFERAGQVFFNALVMIDADGDVLGVYRKSHIPDAVGYQEKYYFSPGRHRLQGLAHAVRRARRRASAGTSGSRRRRAAWRSWAPRRCSSRRRSGPTRRRRRRTRATPGSACSRARRRPTSCRSSPRTAIGVEEGETARIRFYGSSFVADQTGAIVAEASRDAQEVVTATFDLDEVRPLPRALGDVPRPAPRPVRAPADAGRELTRGARPALRASRCHVWPRRHRWSGTHAHL